MTFLLTQVILRVWFWHLSICAEEGGQQCQPNLVVHLLFLVMQITKGRKNGVFVVSLVDDRWQRLKQKGGNCNWDHQVCLLSDIEKIEILIWKTN